MDRDLTKYNLFAKLDKVKHVKTGNIYRIYKTPRKDLRLEHNNESYYQYTGEHDKVGWIRCKSEMEDGRFVLSV